MTSSKVFLPATILDEIYGQKEDKLSKVRKEQETLISALSLLLTKIDFKSLEVLLNNSGRWTLDAGLWTLDSGRFSDYTKNHIRTPRSRI